MAPRRSARRPPPSTAPYPPPSSTASSDVAPRDTSLPQSAAAANANNGASRPPNSRSKRSGASASRSPEQELSPLASGTRANGAGNGKKGKRSPPARGAAALEDVQEEQTGKKKSPSSSDVKMEDEHPADVPELEPDTRMDGSGGSTGEDADADGDGEEGEGETRCWCGNTDDDAFQIQCEVCKMWQHGPCMGFTDQSEVEGDGFHHLCEICRPDLWGADFRRLTRSRDKHKRTPSSGLALNQANTTSPVLGNHPDSPLLSREPKRRATMNSSAAAFDAEERGLLSGGAPAQATVEDEGDRRGSKKRRRADDQDVTSASVPTPPPAPAQNSRARPSRAAAATSTPSKRPRAAHNKAKDPPSPSAGYAPNAAGSIPDHLSHLSFVFADPPSNGNGHGATNGSAMGAVSAGSPTTGLGLSVKPVPINAFSLPALVQHFPSVVAHAASPVPTPTSSPTHATTADPSVPSPPSASTTAPAPTSAQQPTPTPTPLSASDIPSSLGLKCKIKWPSKRITPGEMKKRVGAMLMWGMRVGSELERREERGRELGLWGSSGTGSASASPVVAESGLPSAPAAGTGAEAAPSSEDAAKVVEGEKQVEAVEGKELNVLDKAMAEKMPTLLADSTAPSSNGPAAPTTTEPAPTSATDSAPPSAVPASAPTTTKTAPRGPSAPASTSDLQLLQTASNLTSASQAQDLLRQLTQRLVQVNELWNSRAEVPLGGVGEGVVVSVGRR